MTEGEMALAADYVLGLLEGPGREQFEAAMRGDPALAEHVARLARQLHALDDTVEPVSFDPGLWSRIERGIASLPQDGVRPSLTLQKSEAPARRSAASRPTRQPAWLAAASVLLGAGIGFVAGTALDRTPEPVVIAVLISESDGNPGAIVEAFGDDSVTISPLETFAVPEGRVLQVWTLPDADTGPVSLGTFLQAGRMHLQGPDLPPPRSGQLYEITLEPAPGSPTGRPTGPILVKGLASGPLR